MGQSHIFLLYTCSKGVFYSIFPKEAIFISLLNMFGCDLFLFACLQYYDGHEKLSQASFWFVFLDYNQNTAVASLYSK